MNCHLVPAEGVGGAGVVGTGAVVAGTVVTGAVVTGAVVAGAVVGGTVETGGMVGGVAPSGCGSGAVARQASTARIEAVGLMALPPCGWISKWRCADEALPVRPTHPIT
jgi:hypothetical protein